MSALFAWSAVLNKTEPARIGIQTAPGGSRYPPCGSSRTTSACASAASSTSQAVMRLELSTAGVFLRPNLRRLVAPSSTRAACPYAPPAGPHVSLTVARGAEWVREALRRRTSQPPTCANPRLMQPARAGLEGRRVHPRPGRRHISAQVQAARHHPPRGLPAPRKIEILPLHSDLEHGRPQQPRRTRPRGMHANISVLVLADGAPQGFSIALKLVALAQNGIELSLANLGSKVPHPDLVRVAIGMF